MNKEEIAMIINENKNKIIINLKIGEKASIVYDVESVCINGNCIQLNLNQLFDEREEIENYEYNLGYFEGIRNALMAYHRFPEIDDFYLWLDKELKESKLLRDESYEN
jgi:hypothetical protein